MLRSPGSVPPDFGNRCKPTARLLHELGSPEAVFRVT